MTDKSILNLAPYAVEARPRLVVAAMHGVVARFREPKICIYPLLDALHLLVPKPIVLSFLQEVHEGKFEHRLSTIQDKRLIDRLIDWTKVQALGEFSKRLVRVPTCSADAKPLWMLVSGRSDGHDSLHPYLPCEARFPGGESDQGTDLWLFDQVFSQLAASDNDILTRNVVKVLHALPPRPYHTQLPAIAPEEAREPFHRAEMEKILRDMLDEAWVEALGSSLLDSPESESAFKNIFPVVRFALPWRRRDPSHNEFDFSAQLLIPSQPRAEMKRLLQEVARGEKEFRDEKHMDARAKRQLFETRFNARPENVLAALERPLGQGEGSIADTVFLSGQMDYLATDFTKSKRTEQTSDRAVAEALLLGEHGQQLSYIPVHVGGAAWVALFSMNRDEGAIDADFWRHNFHLYSNIIPVLAASIRRAAHNAYRSAIIDSIMNCLATPGRRNRASINEILKSLCVFFPFPLVQIGVTSGDADLPRRPGELKVDLSANPNSAFNDPLPFDPLPFNEVREACAEAFRSDQLKTLEMSRDNARTWAHEISNAVLPAFSALQRSAGRTATADPDTRSAMHWLLFMGGAARVRNAIGKHMDRAGSNELPTPEGQEIWQLPPAIQRQVIENSFLFLLRSHARLRRESFILTVNGREFDDSDAEAEVSALREIVSAYRRGAGRYEGSDVAIFYSSFVSWPLTLLRELVQNIRLANPLRGSDQPRVDFVYEWVDGSDARQVLRARQRQVERRQWDLRNLPDGIQKANAVYGHHGARFGEVEHVDLCQKRISDSGIYQIEYVLDVRFF